MKKQNNAKVACYAIQKGITLIALVITIIVLLILAGVTINLILGQNGIFITAQKAAKNYTDAQNKELAGIEEFTNVVNNITNPMPFGTIIKTENKINYVADGEGNMIPVPVGFTALTGTKTTGFVIKDTSVDNEGNPTETNGNEFVWVPVEGMSYTYNRYDFKRQYGSYSSFSEAMSRDEQLSVATYGGYYIGRYEVGIDGGTLSSTNNSDSSTTWTGYTGGKLVVQEGKQVWNYITMGRAKTEAEGLYNKIDNNVVSKLCSSYAWDTALKFIETQNSTYPMNSVGGYYEQSSPTTTGYDTVHPCNIYDMGGNVWEWTTESYSDMSGHYAARGGSCSDRASHPAVYRYHDSTTFAIHDIGFRITLFI